MACQPLVEPYLSTIVSVLSSPCGTETFNLIPFLNFHLYPIELF